MTGDCLHRRCRVDCDSEPQAVRFQVGSIGCCVRGIWIIRLWVRIKYVSLHSGVPAFDGTYVVERGLVLHRDEEVRLSTHDDSA